MKKHVGMEAHDVGVIRGANDTDSSDLRSEHGYAPHSHEVRADHEGVAVWCDYHDTYHRHEISPRCVLHREVQVIEIDPTELKPGDVVVRISDHDIAGCHCDVRVTVERKS